MIDRETVSAALRYTVSLPTRALVIENSNGVNIDREAVAAHRRG
jgi:hypothetical protein